jgi:pimeloyl-ACP methyl ester carboxylesterase
VTSFAKKLGLGAAIVTLAVVVAGATLYLGSGTRGKPLGQSHDVSISMKEVPCVENYAGGRCGTVEVPLDYKGRAENIIEVGFIYYPATNPFADKNRVLQLVSGGPGLSMSGFMSGPVPRMLRLGFNNTAMLAIDPRGVGRSTRLLCPQTSNGAGQLSELDSKFVERCAIEAGPTRVYYNTENTVRDFERVKRALGIGKIDLFGFSYGTNASVTYATLFPNEVRSIILDGPYAIQDTALLLTDFHAALIRQLAEACKISKECTPQEAMSALGNVTSQLRAAPRPLKLRSRNFPLPPSPKLDNNLLATMTRFLPGSLQGKHYYPLLGAVLAADKGDWSKLEELSELWMLFGLDPALSSKDAGEVNSTALGRAVDCSELDLLWDPSASVDERVVQFENALDASDTKGELAPFKAREWLSGQDIRSGCLRYPTPPKGFEASKRYANMGAFPQAVPVLLLSGELDMNTPLETGQALAATLRNSYFARFRFNEHLVVISNLCGAKMAISFLETLKVDDPNSCLNSGQVALDIHQLPPLMKNYLAGKPLQ